MSEKPSEILSRGTLEAQSRLVGRYVAGDLSRPERAEFEAWLVASPELAKEVEMERRLLSGIADAARRGWLKRNGTPIESTRAMRILKYGFIAWILFSIAVITTAFLLER